MNNIETTCKKKKRKKLNMYLRKHWASLVAQMVKNLPVVQETQVQSLDREDPLQKGRATHSSILAWRHSINRGAWQTTESDMT